MAGIWNINSTYNVNTKKIMNNLSFEMGQVFKARIIDVDEFTNEVMLKLLDGWQFQAKIQNEAKTLPEGLLKFKVEGFEDGKLKIKILNTEEKDTNLKDNNIIKKLEEQNINISKDDYKILDKMIKHSMPLTRDNISMVKSIIDFKNKIENEPQEIETFINKFLVSKEVDPNTEKGTLYRDKLRVFFESLSSVSENDILTLLENDMELNHENVKSFNKVFKDSQVIYKDLTSFSDKLSKVSSNIDPKAADLKVAVSKAADPKIFEAKAVEPNIKEIKAILSKVNTPEASVPKLDSKIVTANITEVIDKESILKSKSDIKNSRVEDISNIFKEEIKAKTDEIKNIVHEIITNIKTSEENSEQHINISNFLQNSGNDFKVFNTISNQYYYFDLPLKIENYDYGCKLIIKDERKKGKKIDSNDVKIAASVSTENLGIVDAYLTVKNYNMNIDIKSEKEFINVLSSAKEILLKDLSNLGYNVSIRVDKLDKPLNISDSREFFGDNELGNINIRV